MPGTANDLLDTFLDEAGEHLAALEAGLLRAGEGAPDGELMNALFRSAHSIKGGSGLFGLEPITRLTHALEQLLDQMRNGRLPVTRSRVDLMLRAVDGLSGLLASVRGGVPFPTPEGILRELSDAVGGDQKPVPPAAAAPPARTAEYSIDVTPGPQLLANGMDPFLLLRNLSRLGTVRTCAARLDSIPPLDTLDPLVCYVSWRMVLETDVTPDALRDVFAFVESDCTVRVTPLVAAGRGTSNGELFASACTAYQDLAGWVTDNLSGLQRLLG